MGALSKFILPGIAFLVSQWNSAGHRPQNRGEIGAQRGYPSPIGFGGQKGVKAWASDLAATRYRRLLMKVLVVYDSAYGNTEKIARAIGSALGAPPDVEVRRAGDVQPGQLAGLQLLVVGSPTQKFTLLPAVRDFLKGIPENGLQGMRVAAFDTRVNVAEVNSSLLRVLVGWFGYAAEKIAGRLRKKGGTIAAAPGTFFVKGTEGPLADGELERAAKWARQLLG